MVDVFLYAAAGWLGTGALVALPFAFFGAPRVVDGAEGSSIAFRLMIVPGAALLWPLVLRRWVQLRGADRVGEGEP